MTSAFDPWTEGAGAPGSGRGEVSVPRTHGSARAFEDRPGCPLRQTRMDQRGVEFLWQPVAEGKQATILVDVGALVSVHRSSFPRRDGVVGC